MDESRAVESLGPTEGSSGTSQRSIYRRPYTTNIIISIMVSQIIFIYVKNISTTRCLLRCALVCTAHVKHPCALCSAHERRTFSHQKWILLFPTPGWVSERVRPVNLPISLPYYKISSIKRHRAPQSPSQWRWLHSSRGIFRNDRIGEYLTLAALSFHWFNGEWETGNGSHHILFYYVQVSYYFLFKCCSFTHAYMPLPMQRGPVLQKSRSHDMHAVVSASSPRTRTII